MCKYLYLSVQVSIAAYQTTVFLTYSQLTDQFTQPPAPEAAGENKVTFI